MAASTRVKNFRNGTLKVEDGAALTLTLSECKGDFSITGLSAAQRDVAPVLVRGLLYDLVKADQTFPEVSFTLLLNDVHDVANQTAWDAFTRQGAWAAATTTFGSAATADPYTVKLTWTIEGTDLGDGSDHVIVMDDVHIKAASKEGDPNELSASGVVYGSITLT